MSLRSYGLSMNLIIVSMTYLIVTRIQTLKNELDYKLLEEYGTTSREEVARMIIEDLDDFIRWRG